MDGESLLTSAIEVGIALAGFSGIVAVLDQRRQGGWRNADKLRLQLLLQTSFSAVLFSMLPLFLLSMRLMPSSVWRLSSGIWLTYIAIEIPLRIRQVARFQKEAPEPIPRTYAAVVISGLVVTVALQLLNAASLGQAWPHLLTIIWAIILALTQFVRLLREIWQE